LRYLKIILLGAICLVSPIETFSQDNAENSDELATVADKHYQEKNWDKAEVLYHKLVNSDSKNAKFQFRYGMILTNLDRHEEAITHVKNGISLSNRNVIMPYYLATIYAKLYREEDMYNELEQIVESGAVELKDLTEESSFSNYVNEDRFKALLQIADLAVYPCKAKPEYRQLDFWLGDWVAKTPQGFVAGASKIEMILGSCVILENYQQGTFSGKSFNIYDETDEKWHQTWVDNKGNITEYVGSLVDGKLIYYADEIRDGSKIKMRLSFSKLENGNVRQFSEVSNDEGSTWKLRYELIY